MEAEAHPVQFQAVEVVPFRQFPDQLEMVLAHFRAAIVEGAIRPLGEPIRDAAQFGVLAPELTMDVASRIVHIMHVIHPHGEPGRDSYLPASRDPARIDIYTVLV